MNIVLALLAVLSTVQAQDTVLAAYIFHRHGDRTPKALAPTELTDLGYAQVYSSGSYYRNRYIASDATVPIAGVNADIVKQSQLTVSAPQDTVLMNSAQGFLQGLYPPAAGEAPVLRNGTTVKAPLDGYQLIPISTTSSGSGSEDSGWLQDATDCGAAESSSNQYFYSSEYNELLEQTRDFYRSLLPVVSDTFDSSYLTYKNAYSIFDLINVASIHNSSIPSSDLLTLGTLQRLGGLATVHEFNLAYNASSEIRAMAGKQLAGEVVSFFDKSISSSGSSKLGIQFGAYGTFQSYFGLAQLTAAGDLFYGIPDYASSMIWELYTQSDIEDGFPAVEDLRVRFLFHNGTASAASAPAEYPLFASDDMDMSWSSFRSGMHRFAIGSTEQWCNACGNTTGTCAQYAHRGSSSATSRSSSSSQSSSDGLSKVACGVIGAVVALAVILLVQGAIMLLGGLTLVRRSKFVAEKAMAASS